MCLLFQRHFEAIEEVMWKSERSCHIIWPGSKISIWVQNARVISYDAYAGSCATNLICIDH